MDGLERIFARNCKVEKIGRQEAGVFFSANHRLGDTRCRYCYGLFLKKAHGSLAEGTMVAAAGFSGPRTWRRREEETPWKSFEWVRYASLEGYGVDGGMGKVLSAFIEEVHPDDIMSYADASSPHQGEVYRLLGFTEEAPKTFPDGHVSLKFRLVLNKPE